MVYFLYSFFYLAISYIVVSQKKINKDAYVILALGIIFFWGLSYIYAADTFMLSNLIAVFSAWNIIKTKNKTVGILSSAFLLAISLAIYQAYISVFVLVIYLYILFNLLDHESTSIKNIFKLLLNVSLVVILGMILYYIGVKISLRIIDAQLSSYLNWGAITDIKAKGILFIKTYKDFIKTYMNFALHNTEMIIVHSVLFL